MTYLVTKWFGTFLFEKKEIKKKVLFPKKAEEIAKRLYKIKNNEILTEEKKIVKKFKVIVNEKRLQKFGDFESNKKIFRDIEIKPEEFGFSQELLHKASILLTTKEVDKKLRSEDLQVVQMVNALDDLIHISNLLSERLDSWSLIPTPFEKIKPVNETFSVVNKEMKRLEEQIEADMINIAPNISKIAGPLIGARLISIAGGLKNAAFMPASTIQILGAEKALFRYKKEGGRPPKHGVIFQHNLVNKSPRNIRGKIARVLATKIAIAAKADVFTKKDISDVLNTDLEKRVKEIRNL